jgi:CBS domain-containing protein
MEVIKSARVPAVIIAPSATVHQTVTLMGAREVGAVVITNQKKQVLGIFTERDNLLRVSAARRDVDKTRITEVMTSPVDTIPPDMDVQEALEMMIRRRFRHLPIVDSDRRVIGIVSIRYLLMRRMGEQRHSLDILSAYVEAGGPG